MADDAIRLFRMLVEAGAKPGEDFSYDLRTASAQVSDRAFEKLKAAFPDMDWESICERVEVDPTRAVDALNSFLGVDFVGHILCRIEERIDSLDSAEATWYLQQVLGGVEHHTRIPLYVLLQQQLPLSKQARLETLLRQTATPCYVWMSDLIEAAGGHPEDIELFGDEAILTQRGLALLQSVWDGEYDLVEGEALEAEAQDAQALGSQSPKEKDTEGKDSEGKDLEEKDSEGQDLEENEAPENPQD